MHINTHIYNHANKIHTFSYNKHKFILIHIFIHHRSNSNSHIRGNGDSIGDSGGGG
jgi:hypothetical protein